jgi:hypothetical protein
MKILLPLGQPGQRGTQVDGTDPSQQRRVFGSLWATPSRLIRLASAR